MKNIDSINRQEPNPERSPRNTVRLTSSAFPAQPESRGGRKFLKFFSLLVLVACLALAAMVAFRAADLSDKIFVGRKTSLFQKLAQVLGVGGQNRLEGEKEGQINVLLLGIGGEGHDGPFLTDTMIVAQIRPENGEVVMTSIPRDYWAMMPSGSRNKINAAFTEGFMKRRDWNEGGQAALQATENLTGLSIPYFAVVDFAGFKKAVDTIGGLDIKVERPFTDYTFPKDGTLGYLPPQSFSAGWTRMDGSKALIFARSRHAAGPEGSDFARSARQQKVIQAFKQKVINLNLVSDVGKINSLLEVFAEHFHTNISPGEMFRVYTLVKEKNISNFLSLSLDPVTKIVCPQILPENGAYVLVPCAGKSAADIKNFFQNAFAIGKLSEEQSVIWLSVSNGDKRTYADADATLKDAGITVWELPYQGQMLPQTVFYQVNKKPATAEFVKNTLGASEISLPPPGVKIDPAKVDMVIILGGQPDSSPPEQP